MTSIFKKGFASLILFALVAILPISCGVDCNNPCGCSPDFEIKDFNITEMEALTLLRDGQQVSPAGTYPYDVVVKGLRIKTFQTVAFSEKSISNGIPGIAYACSPLPPKSADNLFDVKVINLQEVTLDSGVRLKIGDDISAYFGMNYYFSEGTESIEEFLEGTLTMFSDDLYKLAWLEKPAKELNLRFTIRVQLESGREIALTDQELNVE